ncbi:hypothetical protein WJX81_007849 [Elliptochloris bilobata]|uniref:ATP synthase subunit d, mitochondrial n=1 Tax=Elliptochloris bilobata TaxID=381761 RepID=A0AAW1QHG5_9CHLO
MAFQEKELDSLDPNNKARPEPDATYIDWEYWRTKVEPQLVDKFQNALRRLKLPRYVPTYEVVDATFEPVLQKAKELEEYAANRVVELEAELAKVNYELERLGSCKDPSRPRMTMEEELELNPDIAAVVDQEIMEGKWTT